MAPTINIPAGAIVNIHFQIVDLSALAGRLDQVLAKLDLILKGESQMAIDFAALQAEVAKNTDVELSAKVLIQKLADEIAHTGGDQAKLDALVTSLRANDGNLAAAVAENTPAQPPPPPPPPGPGPTP